MNLEEAIEILQNKVCFEYSASKTNEGDATKLLIEAGKTIKSSRKYGLPVPLSLLPRETKD